MLPRPVNRCPAKRTQRAEPRSRIPAQGSSSRSGPGRRRFGNTGLRPGRHCHNFACPNRPTTRHHRLSRRHRRHKSVAHPRDRLNEFRLSHIIPQQVPQLANRRIDPVFRIHENFTRPQPLRDVRPRHQLALPRRQQDQQLHRLPLHAHGSPIELKLKPLAVQPEISELVYGIAQSMLAW